MGLKGFTKKYGKTLKTINKKIRPLKQLAVTAAATYANTQMPGSGGMVSGLLTKAPKPSIAELPEPPPYTAPPPPAAQMTGGDVPAAGTDWTKIALIGGGGLAALFVLPKLLRKR